MLLQKKTIRKSTSKKHIIFCSLASIKPQKNTLDLIHLFKKIAINSFINKNLGSTKNIFFFNSFLCFSNHSSVKLSSSLFIEFICSHSSLDNHLMWKPLLFPDSYSKKNFSSNLVLHFDHNIFDSSSDFIIYYVLY